MADVSVTFSEDGFEFFREALCIRYRHAGCVPRLVSAVIYPGKYGFWGFQYPCLVLVWWRDFPDMLFSFFVNAGGHKLLCPVYRRVLTTERLCRR